DRDHDRHEYRDTDEPVLSRVGGRSHQETTIHIPFARTRLAPELASFGIVGLVGYLTDVGLFNLLRYAGEPGLLEHKPLTAKAVSVAAAMAITYLGNRYWTWRHRSGRGHGRDFVLFVIFSLIGM